MPTPIYDLALILNLDEQTLSLRRVYARDQLRPLGLPCFVQGATLRCALYLVDSAGAYLPRSGDAAYLPRATLGHPGLAAPLLTIASDDFTIIPETGTPKLGWSFELPLTTAELAAYLRDSRSRNTLLELTLADGAAEVETLYRADVTLLPALFDPEFTPPTYEDLVNAVQAAQAAQLAAEASETAAAGSATAAATARDAAQAAQTAAEAARDAANTSATAAYNSALAASSSATAAAASANAAASARDAAQAAQTAAETAKAAAEVAQAAAAASASAASGSAAASASSATAAASARDAAQAAQAAAEAARDAAQAAQVASAASAAAAAASAAAALTSQNAAAASASAAASSATTALNAIALQFKGGVAGASVPATSTLAGDWYRITSAGTSQSKTWAVGDMAIYNGTSGSWTQIPGALVAEDRVLKGDLGCALKPVLFHDGATSGSRCYARLGTAGDGLGTPGQPFTVLKRFRMPTAAATRNLLHLGSSSDGSTAGFGLQCYLHSTDKLRVEIGDVTSANRRYVGTDLGVVSRYAGLICAVAITYDGSAAKPKLYLQGPEEATTEASTGSAPAWNAGFNDDFLVEGTMQGGSLWVGLAEPAIIINRVLTAAEILAWTQTNRLPDDCELGTGSMVARYTSDFSAGIDSWAITHPGNTITGNVDGVFGQNDCLSIQMGSGNPTGGASRDLNYTRGRRYRITGFLAVPASNTSKTARVNDSSASAAKAGVADYVLTADTWTPFTVEYEASAAQLALRLVGSVATDILYARAVLVYDLGPIAKPKIIPEAIIHPGSGANAIATVTTPGVKALGDKPETIVLPGPAMTADGFVHLDQIITPTGYELAAAYATQTGTATSTITVRETSSGGTTVATAALSASVKQVALTVSNGLLAANKKLHLTNSAWGGNTVTPFFVFRRCS